MARTTRTWGAHLPASECFCIWRECTMPLPDDLQIADYCSRHDTQLHAKVAWAVSAGDAQMRSMLAESQDVPGSSST